jgi:DNA mismatch endonuclease, patch repair protein
MPITRSENMRRIRSSDSKPELRLRQALFACGLRGYRCNARGVPGRPDVFFSRWKLAVFVHGCFWHQHQGCRRGGKPRSNRGYWEPKLAGNVIRDELRINELRELGISALVFWECELQRDTAKAVVAVQHALTLRRDRISKSI